jgi:outer membrane protein OmpA-like peptidoglycan-associated protein
VQRGITSTGRVFGKGYGETRLVNGCACEKKVVSKCTEEEHQQNRRTEFIILKK